MRVTKRVILACCMLTLGGIGVRAETAFPLMPSASMDPDGTLHFKDRTIPMPGLMSAEAKTKYVEILNQQASIKPISREDMAKNFMANAGAGIDSVTDKVLKVLPSAKENSEIGGVKVTTFTPANITARNKNRVVMMFNSDPTGVALAAIGKIKVIAVHYNPTQPQGSTQIVAVYRELLKTHKPSQIAMVGLSGGCQYAANTAMWLPEQKLPFPGALGLLTCAGGGAPGDSRNTLNGLDPELSDYTMFAAMRGRLPGGQRAAAKPGDPGSEILDVTTFPKGWPPSYLLAGSRDMCLSQTVVLHRRLKHSGATTELNIFEGMWHGFTMEPELPETHDAAADLASFLDKHLGT